MHDELTGAPREGAELSSVAEVEDQADRSILTLLLSSQYPELWSIDELARELDKPIDVRDAARRLHCQGLVHRLEDFVFITRASKRLNEIAE